METVFSGPGPAGSDPAAPAAGQESAAPATAARPPASARTADEFDTTTEEERAAAAAPSEGGARLGTTVASLGDVAESGFWLKTPLVDAPAKGRVVYPGTGKSAEVDLIPIEGPADGGSRISLAAMRLIGAPLTDLPEIEVYRK
ncbi:hypothetical protein E0K89_010990 [Aquicoccus sp. SCR17]|nr:hypothetical protein [Carideicomes alvinocaridis]